jgi:transposase
MGSANNSSVFHPEGEVVAIIAIGIDLAKNVFAVHGVDASGKAVLVRPAVRRDARLEFVAMLPPCLIGIEACSGAHHRARQFQQFGHQVRIIAAKFVVPYRLSGKRGKNDAADAQAIFEAVQRPQMCLVPIKSEDAQGRLSIHRVRQGFIEQCTATINRIRGLLSEYGHVLPQRAEVVRRQAGVRLEGLPGWANTAIGDLLSELHRLVERVAEYGRHIETMAKADDRCRKRMAIPGNGDKTATALMASIGCAHDFKCGKQLAAWLGLVPSQDSWGGKQRLGRITKAGDSHLRMLLILGARAVVAPMNARMAWAMLSEGEAFRPMT